MPPKENRVHPAKFIGRTEVAHETFEVRFKLEQPFLYEAGQYAWLQLPIMKYPDVRGDRRAFSITNPPDASGEIRFLFRGNDSGFKKTACALEDGDEVFIIGPFGTSFCLPENPHTPLVLVAGGVGIAPFLCLMRYIKQKNLGHPVTVVYADSSKERMVYTQEVDGIAEKKSARTGKCITKKLVWKDFKDIPELSKSLVYVSGTQGFVDYVHTLLKKNGIFGHRFRFENFYPTPAERFFREVFKNIATHENSVVSSKSDTRPDVLLAAVESSSHHIIITDSNGTIVFCNKAAQDVTGYTFAEMEGQTPRLWGGLMPRQFYADMWKALLEGNTVNEEIINRKKDGTLYTVIAHIAPIHNKAGEVVGFIGTEEDVTHIRSAEQQARQNEERFVQLTEKITEVYWIIELIPAEHAAYVSPAFEPLWGMPRGTLKKNPRAWLTSVHSEDRQAVETAYDACVRTGAEYHVEYRIMVRGETRWVNDQGKRVAGEDGTPSRIVRVSRDITLEKTIDRAKTEFVSLASHQLKTPLGAISWDAEMLLHGDYGALHPKQREVVEEMYRTNLRMKQLVDGLLNVSRIDLGTLAVEPEPVQFADVCDEVLDELEASITQKKHTVIKEYDATLPLIPADPKLLRIIFQNFLSNAVKYTPSEGRIRISIHIENGEIVLRVFNNGAPIPKNDQDKIFTKLFRAGNAQEQDPDGTGLGLYIVKSVVEEGGGRVWSVSREGEDTEFGAAFPVTGMRKKEKTGSGMIK